jgi:hypothetical protein
MRTIQNQVACTFILALIPLWAGTQFSTLPVEGLKRYAKVFDNCEIEYVRKDSNGAIEVEGVFRSRDGQFQEEFQYAGDDKRVHVSREDASFRVDQSSSHTGQWLPRMLSPGSKHFKAAGSGGTFGPRDFLNGYTVLNVPLWVLFDESQSVLKDWALTDVRETASEQWDLTIANKSDPSHRCRLVLEGSPICRCTKQETLFNGRRVVQQISYEDLNGVPIIRSIDETVDGIPVGSTEFRWNSTQAAPEKFFRLENYGLSESLLRPLDPNPASGEWIYVMIGLGLGLVLLFASQFLRRRSSK